MDAIPNTLLRTKNYFPLIPREEMCPAAQPNQLSISLLTVDPVLTHRYTREDERE